MKRPAGLNRPQASHLPSLFVLLVSLLLTGMVWWSVRLQADRLADVRFAGMATDIVTDVDKRMRDYEQILRGGVAFFRALEGDVTRAEWRDYVAGLRVEESYPGLQGMGFSLRVTEPVAAHEAAMRAQGLETYSVSPADPRDEVHAIIYLEPQDDRNIVALGYDMFSEPTRREAMERARDTARPAMSGRVRLVQEITRDVQNGVLLYLPVYQDGEVPDTVEARREDLLGFVYSPFRMGDLMRGILGERLEDTAVRVTDVANGKDGLLFGPTSLPATSYVYSAAIEVYGRRWLIEVAARPDLQDVLASQYPLIVLVAGFIISGLLWWLSRAMMAERQRRLALARANRQLGRARADAEAAGRSKSMFLAAASHDIRQPVQSLVLLVGALGRKLKDHPAQSYVTQLERSLDALRLLLDGLLDISRLDAGVVEPQVRATSVGDLLDRLRRDYAPRARDEGLDLRVVACSCWVLTDPALLERILRNLIENALRYTPSGRVLVGCRRRGTALRFEVHDTGIGIAPQDRGAVFEEFFQVGNPERDRDKGLGLGLAIVRRLCGLLGHRLSLRSEVGRGSCFAVEVPRAAAADMAGRGAGDAQEVAPRATTVLVVDDEEMVRDAVRLMLIDWGCTALVASDADEALAALDAAEHPPDVVIADYRLRGGRTGLDAIRQVRSHLRRQVPAVLLTGDTAPERIMEATRGGHVILHKPISHHDLRRALDDAMARS